MNLQTIILCVIAYLILKKIKFLCVERNHIIKLKTTIYKDDKYFKKNLV